MNRGRAILIVAASDISTTFPFLLPDPTSVNVGV